MTGGKARCLFYAGCCPILLSRFAKHLTSRILTAMLNPVGHYHSSHSGHTHGAAGMQRGKAFAIAVALNMAMVVAEMIAGVAAGSMALIADAGHNFSDVIG